MKLLDHTGFPSMLFRTTIDDDDTLAAAAVVRVTYALRGEELVPIEPAWAVSSGPWSGPQGPMEGDGYFYKQGVDLLVFGCARAPEGRAVTEMEVTVETEGLRHRVRVVGDRVWERGVGRLVPGEPAPFVEMPLTLARAYGGVSVWDELPFPAPDNPHGRGFYWDVAEALGRPLPNLEAPDRPITRWDDRPPPVGVALCPAASSVRALRGARFDDDGQLREFRPMFYNCAFPGMIAASVKPGQRVRITGVRAHGPLTLCVPPTPFRAHFDFGDRHIEVEPAIDELGVECDAHRVFITYRHPFRYKIVPGQTRSCALVPTT